MVSKRRTAISVLLAMLMAVTFFLGTVPFAAAAGQSETYSVSNFSDSYWYYGRTDSQFLEDSLDITATTGWTYAATMIGFPTGGQGSGHAISTLLDAGSAPGQRGTPLHTWTYFKKTFELPADFDAAEISDVSGIHVIDDALVILINGIEVYRYNAAPGGINVSIGTAIDWSAYHGYNTEDLERAFDINSDYNNREAGPTGQGDSNVLRDAASLTNLASALRPGTNVITCIVGQRDSSSSDLFFDLKLDITVGSGQTTPALAVSYLTLAPGSDASEMNFSWQTAALAANPQVRIWSTSGAAQEFSGTCSSSVSSISGLYYSNVTVTGLTPDTAYSYQVGDGAGNWSAVLSTKTANPAAFSYIVVGDPQIGSSGNVPGDTASWLNTMGIIEARFPNAAFLAGTGDQIETSGTLAHYTGFFSPVQMASLPFASCMGNHEGSGAATRTFYNPPNADSVQNYWYRYGDALFLVWNCTTGSPATMRSFLQSAFDANPDATWAVLNFHYDVYGQGTSHALSDGKSYRDQYAAVIDEFDIDVVFNGHDHSYSRSYPMIYSGSAATSNSLYVQDETFGPDGASINPTGTVYFSLNSATGSKYYTLEALQPYTAAMHQANRPQFSVVDVTASTFTCTTYQIASDNSLSVIDTYTIRKTNNVEPAGLVLATSKNIVKPGDYFTVAISFPEQVESNVVILDLAFDASQFSFANFAAPAGATVLSQEYGDGYASIMLMVPNYNMSSLGDLMLLAKDSVTVSSTAVSAAASFVERDANQDKTIRQASGSYLQKTSNAGSDDYVIDLITLSNLIDAFGKTAAELDWDYFGYFDFNGNDMIDVFDISTVAQMVR